MNSPAWRLRPEPLNDAAEAAGIGLVWGDAEVGLRHRVGGDCPLSDSDRPVCSSCRERMAFYGQLDTMNDDIVIADAGLLAVFICHGCGEAAAVVVSP